MTLWKRWATNGKKKRSEKRSTNLGSDSKDRWPEHTQSNAYAGFVWIEEKQQSKNLMNYWGANEKQTDKMGSDGNVLGRTRITERSMAAKPWSHSVGDIQKSNSCTQIEWTVGDFRPTTDPIPIWPDTSPSYPQRSQSSGRMASYQQTTRVVQHISKLDILNTHQTNQPRKHNEILLTWLPITSIWNGTNRRHGTA